jgi:4-hydroxybenzoate polyprenyltransferase
MNSQDEPDRVPPLISYLELLRLPNIFTAMADVVMGFLFVLPVGLPGGAGPAGEALVDATGGLRPLGLWVMGLLIAASSLLYAGGVVLNSVFDIERDRDERPDRPMPSGRISLRAARWIGWEGLFWGAALACGVALILHQYRPTGAGWLIEYRPAVIAALLVAAILLYNVGLKQTILGPLVMGSCRMLNVLLGMSVLPAALWPENWIVAGAVGLYIAGVTWFARNESQRSGRPQLLAATVVMMGGVALLGWLPRWAGDRLLLFQQDDPGRWYLIMALLGGVICMRCLWAVAVPVPGRVRVAVAQAIISLVFLDAAACYAARGTYWAAVILALLIPTTLLGRWIETT